MRFRDRCTVCNKKGYCEMTRKVTVTCTLTEALLRACWKLTGRILVVCCKVTCVGCSKVITVWLQNDVRFM